MNHRPWLCSLLFALALQVAGSACATSGTVPSDLLTVQVTGIGTVISSPPGISCTNAVCTASFPRGTSITLATTAPTGTSFVLWGGGACGIQRGGTCSFPLSGPSSVNAIFASVLLPLTVTVASGGSQAGGSVASSPAGIDCPSGACTANFSAGSTVVLTATPATGYTFDGWGAPCSGTAACAVPINTSAANITATFTAMTGVTAQTGYWWNTSQAGRGYMIEQSGGNLFFAAYLYDDAGRATWYSAGPSPVVGGAFSAPLNAYSGGQTLTGQWKTASTGASPGSVTLQFTDSQHANMTWPGGTIAIERYSIVANGLALPPLSSAQPESGYWWNPNEAGRGFGIEVQGGTAFIAAYMYNPDGSPVWYATLNPVFAFPGGNSTAYGYSGTWAQYANGQALTGAYRSPAIVNANVGAAAIQFTSSSAGTLTLPDGRQIPIVRFKF